jgi:hypothetical protein
MWENTVPLYVVTDLEEMHGPDAGHVVLPLRLDWTPSNSYDLSQPNRVRSLYATVLREAKSEDDLINYLDADVLRREWRSLRLPAFIRETWETVHPVLGQC